MERYQITTLSLTGEAMNALPPLISRTGVIGKLLQTLVYAALTVVYEKLWGKNGRVTVYTPRPHIEYRHIPALYDGWQEQLEHTGQAGSLTALLNRTFAPGETAAAQLIHLEDVLPEGRWLTVYDETAMFEQVHLFPAEETQSGSTYTLLDNTVAYDEQVILEPTTAFEVHIPLLLYNNTSTRDRIMATVNRYRLASRTAVAVLKTL